MKVWMPCWGEKHINLFSQAAGRTLSWPKNREAIKGSEWTVLTNGEFNDKALRDAIAKVDETAKVNFDYCPDLMTSHGDKGPLLLHSLLKMIEKCLLSKEPLLMVTPDYIYGDGTIANMKKIAKDRFSVSFAHMRVEKEVLDCIEAPLSNEQIMRLGMARPHATWTKSEVSIKDGFTFWGGISWEKMDEYLYAVTHFLPAPFLVNFVQSDLDFFKAKHEFPHDKLTFALWDHLFPTKLIQEGRLKYIGSSDIACMIEVTETDANLPPVNPEQYKNIDGYVKGKATLHNLIQGEFVATFRGE